MPSPSVDLATRIERHDGALSVVKVVKETGMGRTKVYQLCRECRIPHYRFDDVISFDPFQLAAWIREHRVEVAA